MLSGSLTTGVKRSAASELVAAIRAEDQRNGYDSLEGYYP